MSTHHAVMDIVIFGLSITSAWGNGHATTYRALVRALSERGHRVRFFERDVPWYAGSRDLPSPPWCRTFLYRDIADLEHHFGGELRADLVILGSYVPEGARLAQWLLPRASGLVAFYDIDTPVTVARLQRGDCDYLTPSLVPRFDLYLSFSGGPILEQLRKQLGARCVRPLYCSVDPTLHHPCEQPRRFDLAYLGTYSPDRQPALQRLLIEPARRWPAGRFRVAGAQYPAHIGWPVNVERVEHLAPGAHREFYGSQAFTLNVTRADMIASGYSPSVRLFEAAACGVPIITDEWPGLETFFVAGSEILIARSADDVLHYLRELDPELARQIARRARERVLAAHTATHRALEIERYVREATSLDATGAGPWSGSAALATASGTLREELSS